MKKLTVWDTRYGWPSWNATVAIIDHDLLVGCGTDETSAWNAAKAEMKKIGAELSALAEAYDISECKIY
jgi:hypothetical protein